MHFESVDELVLHLKKLVIKQKHHLSTFHCPNSSPGAQGLGGGGRQPGKVPLLYLTHHWSDHIWYYYCAYF